MVLKFKEISLVFVLLIFISANCAYAVLTKSAPEKHKNVNKQTINTKSITSKYSEPIITAEQKQKYINDYILYLEQTIIDTGCFTSSDIANADITVNLSFDSNYNVADVAVAAYSHRGSDIDRESYYQKCKRCESKIYSIKFKPFDSKYADVRYSTNSFYIKLTDVETQKNLATEQLINSLKDYWATPNYDGYDQRRCLGGFCSETNGGQYAIAKVILTFDNKSFAIKSYSIVNSSNDVEYNQMVGIALKRWATNVNWNISCDYNHRIGELTTYLNFKGNNIYPYNPIENSANNSLQQENTSKKFLDSNIISFPTYDDFMFGNGSNILP